MRTLLLGLMLVGAAWPQAYYQYNPFTRQMDVAGDLRLLPVGSGVLASRPATCTTGQVYVCLGTGCTNGINLHLCRATDTWEAQGSSGGAPSDATYVTTSANGTLSAEASLGALADNSIVAVDVAAGVATPRAALAGDVPDLSAVYQPVDAALTALAAGSDFVDFAGPTIAAKTFTLPDADANVMTMGTANDTDNAVAVAVGTSGAAFEKTAVLIDPSTAAITGVSSLAFGADPADAGLFRISNNTTALASEIATPGTDMTFGSNTSDEWVSNAPIRATEFRTTSTGAAGLLGLLQGTACTPATNEVCVYAPASVTAFGLLLPGAVGSTGVVKVAVSGTVATYSHAALTDTDLPEDVAFTGSVALPNGTGPTVDAAGEIAVDTTTDQLQFYGGAKRALPSLQFISTAIAAPAEADDINLMKAPYAMTIVGISCIVQGTTSATGQLQECSATGGDCADLDSDITCDADGAADDGTLTDSAIASGAWIRWKTTSLSGTPTFLTVTATYRVVPD